MLGRVWLCLLCLALVPAPLAAQPAQGTVTGVVRDVSGAPLPGVTVRVIAEATGTLTAAATDADGRFSTPPLTPGAYRVEAVLEGFETIRRTVSVVPGTSPQIDFALPPSSVSESLVVTARRTEEV